MRIATLAAAVVLVLLAARTAPAPEAVGVGNAGDHYRIVLNDSWLGFTACGREQASAWVRVDVLGTRHERHVVAHERKHRAIIRRDGGCIAHKALMQANPRTALRAESEAYCESARVWSRQHRIPLDSAVAYFADWLATYPYGLTREDAAREIRAFCSS